MCRSQAGYAPPPFADLSRPECCILSVQQTSATLLVLGTILVSFLASLVIEDILRLDEDDIVSVSTVPDSILKIPGHKEGKTTNGC